MDCESPENIQKLISDLAVQARSFGGSSSDEDFFRRQDLLQKAKQLVRDLTPPEELVHDHMLSVAEVTALRSLLKFDALSHFPTDGSAITLAELSKATGVQASLIERFLRTLVLTRFVEQDGDEGSPYRHTRLSKGFVQPAGPQHLFKSMCDDYGKYMIRFDDYLDVRGLPWKEPDDIKKCPYSWGNNRDGEDAWTIMSSNPERIENFQIALGSYDKAVTVTGGGYDYNKLKTDDPHRVEFVDVGGGHGRVLKEILAASPALTSKKCVLQEVPNVVKLAKDIGGLPEDVSLMVHDFNTDQPVRGARAYHLRFITHDYSDAVNFNILSKIAAAMAPDSVLLIAEMVLPQKVALANVLGMILDNVMLVLGGKERTEKAFIKLLDDCGLELVHLYRAARGPGAIIEARLKR